MIYTIAFLGWWDQNVSTAEADSRHAFHDRVRRHRRDTREEELVAQCLATKFEVGSASTLQCTYIKGLMALWSLSDDFWETQRVVRGCWSTGRSSRIAMQPYTDRACTSDPSQA